jgi:hypothetical protein
VLEAIERLTAEGSPRSTLGDDSRRPRFYRRGGSEPFEVALRGTTSAGPASARASWDPQRATESSPASDWQVEWSQGTRSGQDDDGFRQTLASILLDFENAPDIPAEDVSEGTLVTLAFVIALCAAPRPHTFLFDDLGLSLHPTGQMELVRQIHRLLAEMPDVQILATTHSPYILDEMKPEDVVVMAARSDGTVASKKLSEHPDAKMTGYLTTGELWGLGDETTWVL